MYDIWSFLLQTLNVTGIAVLILTVKALFRDKLPPKWQFAVWSVLGFMMLIPAGIFGRYSLFRWQTAVEIVKSQFGDYSFTNVLHPLPIIEEIPQTFADWLFAVYFLGVIVFMIKYAVSYLSLRLVLRRGTELSAEKMSRIKSIAEVRGINLCRVIEAEGLPSAFVCGIISPVLAIPSERELDEKVILHELFHLKNRDTLWSVIICALRCLHWCNPVVIYCANRALNDMESRCDQYVLENIEGEERREYGRILLSMSNERFSKTAGSTSINNGGKNIGKRIENIVRFKQYPKGMGLVSVCIVILLAFPLVIGVKADSLIDLDSIPLTLASARSTPCTTPAGAFDTYAKAVMVKNGYYRAMCAPEELQDDILNEMLQTQKWEPGLDGYVDSQKGYYVYNLTQVGDTEYEALLVLDYPPAAKDDFSGGLALQNLRVEKENGRWVAVPLEDFRFSDYSGTSLSNGDSDLPGLIYSGEKNNMKVEFVIQTVHTVENTVTDQNDLWFLSTSHYNTVPKPNTDFTGGFRSNYIRYYHTRSESEKWSVSHIGLSTMPVYEGEERPEALAVPKNNAGYSKFTNSVTGEQCISKQLLGGWGPMITIEGGGGSINPKKKVKLPEYFAADLYINRKKVAELDLVLQKGGAE